MKGKIFATADPGGAFLHVFVDEHAVRAATALDPKAFEELWWGKKLSGVRVLLDHASEDLVQDLLDDAWTRKATKRLREQRDGGA